MFLQHQQVSGQFFWQFLASLDLEMKLLQQIQFIVQQEY